MDQLLICGGKSLYGEVTISGAKNAALPILCATLLTDEPVILHNVPHLKDVSTTLRLLSGMGVQACRRADGAIEISAANVTKYEAPYNLVKTMRASILVLGPLVARFGTAHVSLPGGCAIGQRPIDQHIKGLAALGANICVKHGFVIATSKRLQGTVIRSDVVTVTGTENLLMAAVLAEGSSVLENAATEPEVVDLANLLIAMGAKITGHGTTCIAIEGVERLYGATHTIIPDRIEAGTFLCALAANRGDITLRKVNPDHLGATLDKLLEVGLSWETGPDWIRASMAHRPKSAGVRTHEYPGFATDMQAQFMALNALATGTAIITENIFENRFMHVQELSRLGADIEIDGHTAVVRGVAQLSGATVMATDLRASACLVIAGLAAKGSTLIDRVYHLDRGYDQMEVKLRSLGANIKRIAKAPE